MCTFEKNKTNMDNHGNLGLDLKEEKSQTDLRVTNDSFLDGYTIPRPWSSRPEKFSSNSGNPSLWLSFSAASISWIFLAYVIYSFE